MDIFEVESLLEELTVISGNIKISAEMLSKHGYKDDSRHVEFNAKRIEEIRDVVKEHLELKVFLRNLLK